MTWREWPLLSLYLALAWEHQFISFYLHGRIVLARQHNQLGHLDLLVVEEGVREKAQWDNHGDELLGDEQYLSNHH